jgi:predicted site-specific integrase-resolvase
MTTDDLWTARMVMDHLHVTRATLTRWEHSGRLIPIRLSGQTFRWRKADVDRLVGVVADVRETAGRNQPPQQPEGAA